MNHVEDRVYVLNPNLNVLQKSVTRVRMVQRKLSQLKVKQRSVLILLLAGQCSFFSFF